MTDPKPQTNPRPLFQLGFRPFFLLAAIAGILLIGAWLLTWSGLITGNFYYPSSLWHAHEMLFGYTVAVIAGFILTAVRNWTGMDTAIGKPLIILALIWLAGRILPLFSGIPHGIIALADLAFLPALVISLMKPLWQGENKMNRIFIPLILSMLLANTLVHIDILGYANTASQGLSLMLDLILLLILIISGRVLPFFTNMAVAGTTAKQWPWVERSSIGLMIVLILAHLFMGDGWMDDSQQPTALVAFLLAVTLLIRISGWYQHGIWKIPVLWVLYTAYGWLVIGMLLAGLSALGLFQQNLATHALTVGVIGIFTLGMMARVSLGHTARPMRTATSTNIAFVLINLATLIRVFVPALLPDQYSLWIQLSGGLWLAAFILFTIIYLPILIQPRLDGKPG